MPCGKCVPKEAVVSPAVPVVTAPRVCELCGQGFETNFANWNRWESDHGGGNEVRID